MGSDDGDNILTLTITDGELGDDDNKVNSIIVDQGGPGQPWPTRTVGGKVFSVNKLTLLTPYITIAFLIMTAILIKKRKH